MFRSTLWLVVCLLLCVESPHLFAEIPEYRIVELCPIEEGASSALALNEEGEVLFAAQGADRSRKTFLWKSQSDIQELPDLSDEGIRISGFNNQGRVIGYKEVTPPDDRIDEARKRWEVQKEQIRRRVRSVQERPRAYSSQIQSNTRSIPLQPNPIIRRGRLPMGPNNLPMPSVMEPFLWVSGEFKTTGFFGNEFNTRVSAINNQGQILGSIGANPVIWSSTGEITLLESAQPGLRTVSGLNDSSTWVGLDKDGMPISSGVQFPPLPSETRGSNVRVLDFTNLSDVLIRCTTHQANMDMKRFYLFSKGEWKEIMTPGSNDVRIDDMNDHRVMVGRAYKLNLQERLQQAGIETRWKWLESLSYQLEDMDEYVKFAFVLSEGEFRYLEDCLVDRDGWENLSNAKAINNKG